MLFDRQRELISGQAVGCHGDRAARRGSQHSLHRSGLQPEGNHFAALGKHSSDCLQPAPDTMGQGKN